MLSELEIIIFFRLKSFLFPVPTVTTTDSLANKYQKTEVNKRKCSVLIPSDMAFGAHVTFMTVLGC